MTVAASPNGVGDRIASREHVRTMRMKRHLVVAGLTSVACIVVGPTFYNLPELLALAVVIGVVLGSLARAVDARIGYCWGWLYGEPRCSTRLDRAVDGVLRRLTAVQIRHSLNDRSFTRAVDDDPRVRILPIDPERD